MGPEAVAIREVGPRDGFQNESVPIRTADKIRLIEKLAGAGFPRLEVTSFARADVIPQLADAAEVLAAIEIPAGVSLSVLVPNRRGLENALKVRDRFHEVGVFVSASETHNKRNVHRTIAQSVAELDQMIPLAVEAGLHCEAVIATAFGCPYEGRVDPNYVIELAGSLVELGATEIGFGDTTGMANPRQVREFFERAAIALPEIELTAHFHNTRGQGLANVLAAHDAGVASFESSFGELGGCPVPPGSTGNVATEDVVSMFHEMGVATGVDLEALIDASRDLQQLLGRQLGSHVLTAGPVRWS